MHNVHLVEHLEGSDLCGGWQEQKVGLHVGLLKTLQFGQNMFAVCVFAKSGNVRSNLHHEDLALKRFAYVDHLLNHIIRILIFHHAVQSPVWSKTMKILMMILRGNWRCAKLPFIQGFINASKYHVHFSGKHSERSWKSQNSHQIPNLVRPPKTEGVIYPSILLTEKSIKGIHFCDFTR